MKSTKLILVVFACGFVSFLSVGCDGGCCDPDPPEPDPDHKCSPDPTSNDSIYAAPISQAKNASVELAKQRNDTLMHLASIQLTIQHHRSGHMVLSNSQYSELKNTQETAMAALIAIEATISAVDGVQLLVSGIGWLINQFKSKPPKPSYKWSEIEWCKAIWEDFSEITKQAGYIHDQLGHWADWIKKADYKELQVSASAIQEQGTKFMHDIDGFLEDARDADKNWECGCSHITQPKLVSLMKKCRTDMQIVVTEMNATSECASINFEENCVIDENKTIDYDSSLLMNELTLADWHACQDRCSKFPACNAWTYNKESTVCVLLYTDLTQWKEPDDATFTSGWCSPEQQECWKHHQEEANSALADLNNEMKAFFSATLVVGTSLAATSDLQEALEILDATHLIGYNLKAWQPSDNDKPDHAAVRKGWKIIFICTAIAASILVCILGCRMRDFTSPTESQFALSSGDRISGGGALATQPDMQRGPVDQGALHVGARRAVQTDNLAWAGSNRSRNRKPIVISSVVVVVLLAIFAVVSGMKAFTSVAGDDDSNRIPHTVKVLSVAVGHLAVNVQSQIDCTHNACSEASMDALHVDFEDRMSDIFGQASSIMGATQTKDQGVSIFTTVEITGSNLVDPGHDLEIVNVERGHLAIAADTIAACNESCSVFHEEFQNRSMDIYTLMSKMIGSNVSGPTQTI